MMLCDNTTSSTKLEVTCCNATKAGPSYDHRQHAAENLIKFGCVVFALCEQTDRQANILITILQTHLTDK